MKLPRMLRRALCVAFLLVLVPLLAPAQQHGDTSVSRGDALRKREYQTYAAVTLYMDPTGSDTGTCTSTGTGACLTLAGAWSKLPSRIRHSVTINVAAGTYSTATTTLSGEVQVINPASPSVTFNITGPSQVAVTPATGTATGSITGTATGGGILTLSDSAQTWTVDDLEGRYARITSGAAIGRLFPITANTATTLRLWAGAPPLPTIADTYSIESPAATLGPITIGDIGLITVTFNNLDIVSTTTAAALNTVGAGSTKVSVNLVGSRSINTNASGAATATSLSTFSSSTNTPPIFLGNGGVALSVSDVVNSNFGFYARSAGTVVARIHCLQRRASAVPGCTWLTAAIRSTAAGSVFAPVQFTPGRVTLGGDSAGTLNILCTNGVTHSSGGAGLFINGVSSSNSAVINLAVENCPVGFGMASSDASFFLGQAGNGTMTCTNVATCVRVDNGMRFKFGTYSATGVTNDYSIDGVNYSAATLDSFSPRRIIGPNLSVVER